MNNHFDQGSAASAQWAQLASAQAGQTQRQPDQPITARIDQMLKEAHDMASRLGDIANRIAGSTPELSGIGSASATEQLEPPLTRKIDHLSQAMQRIERQIGRINGAL